MSRFDSEGTRPPRIAVNLTGSGHHPGAGAFPVVGAASDTDLLVDLAEPSESWREVLRVRAVDLRAAQCRCATVRSELIAVGRDPAAVSVLIDVYVMIAPDAPTARRRLAELNAAVSDEWHPETMLYVGTPTGLAGLIADMHAVGIADGVTLLPLSIPHVLGRIAFETIPWLESVGVRMSRTGVRTLRERGTRACATPSPADPARATQLV